MFYTVARILQCSTITGKLLSECDRGCILRMRSADLDNILERFFLDLERVGQMFQRRIEPMDRFNCCGDMDRCREAVIGRLAHINVVVGMDRLFRPHFTTEKLDSPV